MPFFFTGLKVATTLTLIGAVVGEYFGGLTVALGRVVVGSASALRFDVTWAAILVVSVMGIGLYLVVIAHGASGHSLAPVGSRRGTVLTCGAGEVRCP